MRPVLLLLLVLAACSKRSTLTSAGSRATVDAGEDPGFGGGSIANGTSTDDAEPPKNGQDTATTMSDASHTFAQ